MASADPIVSFFTLLFLEPPAIWQALGFITPDDFEDKDWRQLYRAIELSAQDEEPLDVVHIVRQLVRLGMKTFEAGELIDRATDGIPLPGCIGKYAQAIHEKSKHRTIVALMTTAQDAEGSRSADEIIEGVLPEIWRLQADKGVNQVTVVGDTIGPVMQRLHDIREGSIEGAGLQTKIDGVDLATNGLMAGELWIVGALPGRGKTAFALQVAGEAAGNGIPTLLISLEMSAAQVIHRMVGGIIEDSLRNPRHLRNPEWIRALDAAGEMKGWPLYIDDASTGTALQISSRARQSIHQHGIKLVVVDYLQLIRGSGRELRERVGDAGNVLRQLAKDTGVPVIALSQLRRPGNINDQPTMIDLKESGDLEAHAHVVMLLYTPMDEGQQPTGEDEIIIGKNRNGPLGTIHVTLDRKAVRFRSRYTAAGQ